ncbi:uncharacterized protein LACBIDRAFT_298368 [Laccaria bicolor S238N-H82]|uniref:WD40 repeat-containing protein SMU1 n=1 Tax=Laccaria bicolor (strain S238N-H82 / ATCC MYA-4686) TaxID=486041 RepID=B0E3D2_LACBS|nr:uncharacterized protein LACBIDRAFT_298368 [Laccaria bicolor S238N-H82]EDQ98653.1 predicted protein [Laccaria bicolor S238N-H82]|eukprot:XP_001890700.1 predicted protein [Laccaria bicolor S238N-H82]
MVHLLHWLEIISLMGTVNHAAQLLLLAANWSKVPKPSLSDFAKDANRFVMEFLEPISDAAPHIYLSALPFAPQSSKISLHFLKLFQKTLTVQIGQREHWSEKCFLRLVGHDDYVTSVAFSPDGRHIVSGSDDKTVRVWDAQTGQSVMDPLKGHDDYVTSVAFSPDGRHIVSGSEDKTVRVWDAQTGQSVMDPLKGHDDWVTSVAFSSDGRHIVSGSDHKTVRVWDACDFYDIPLLKFCHYDRNWIMLPDNAHLLWLPDQNKSGLFWPRTTALIGAIPISLQFNNFVHGINWSQCLSSLCNPI